MIRPFNSLYIYDAGSSVVSGFGGSGVAVGMSVGTSVAVGSSTAAGGSGVDVGGGGSVAVAVGIAAGAGGILSISIPSGASASQRPDTGCQSKTVSPKATTESAGPVV